MQYAQYVTYDMTVSKTLKKFFFMNHFISKSSAFHNKFSHVSAKISKQFPYLSKIYFSKFICLLRVDDFYWYSDEKSWKIDYCFEHFSVVCKISMDILAKQEHRPESKESTSSFRNKY